MGNCTEPSTPTMSKNITISSINYLIRPSSRIAIIAIENPFNSQFISPHYILAKPPNRRRRPQRRNCRSEGRRAIMIGVGLSRDIEYLYIAIRQIWIPSTVTVSAYHDLSCRPGLMEDHHSPRPGNATAAICRIVHDTKSIS